MRIGIDYHVAVSHAPGVGRYVRELVRALVPLAGQDFELALLDLGLEPRALDRDALGLSARAPKRVVAPIPRRFAAPLARFAGLGADRLLGGVELFHHARAPLLPVSRARASYAVAELPERGSPAEGEFAARLAALDGLIVFSAHYERELARRFALDPARIHRTTVGCEHWLRVLPSSVERADPPEIVVLGAIARRRMPLVALRAFERLVAGGRKARIAFLGRLGDEARELESALERSSARASIEWDRAPREAELPLRVARAATLLHLAQDEGTAVTPLEAFSLGTPVVASELPAFVEALGGAARFVANECVREAPEQLASALDASIASHHDAQADEARRAIARAFTWERNALDTLAAWRAILERAAH